MRIGSKNFVNLFNRLVPSASTTMLSLPLFEEGSEPVSSSSHSTGFFAAEAGTGATPPSNTNLSLPYLSTIAEIAAS